MDDEGGGEEEEQKWEKLRGGNSSGTGTDLPCLLTALSRQIHSTESKAGVGLFTSALNHSDIYDVWITAVKEDSINLNTHTCTHAHMGKARGSFNKKLLPISPSPQHLSRGSASP